MSRDLTNSISNYLSATGPDDVVTTSDPYTIACWIQPDTISGGANDFTVMSKYDGHGPLLRIISSKIRFFIIDGSETGQEAIQGSTLNNGVWNHVGGGWGGPGTGLEVRWNGTGVWTTGTVTHSATQAPNWYLGIRGTIANPFDGRIAEVGIWRVRLTGAEWTRLAQGVSPLHVRPDKLAAYWPIYGEGSPEIDLSGAGFPMTLTGTAAKADHAPVGPMTSFMPTFEVFETALVDAATVYVDIQITSTDNADTTDSATLLVDIQPSGTDLQTGAEEASTFYVDIQPSSTAEGIERSDSSTVLVDIQASTAVELHEISDSATIYVDIQNVGGECFSRLHLEDDGFDYLRWIKSGDDLRWSGDENLRWVGIIAGVEPNC